MFVERVLQRKQLAAQIYNAMWLTAYLTFELIIRKWFKRSALDKDT